MKALSTPPICLAVAYLLPGCAPQSSAGANHVCGDPRDVDVSRANDGGSATSIPVDASSLLDEMTALGRLARQAPNPFRICMVSSYDRGSQVPEMSSDTATGWFANHDWGNYLATENGPDGVEQAVLLDVDGPGAIVRIWSATPTGTLRIYVDFADIPALEAPMADLLAGKIAQFLPPFAGTTAQGGNLEFPFPFRRHVKVAWAGAAGFYQITYRKYAAAAAQVDSFDLSAIGPGKVDLVRTALQHPPMQGDGVASEQVVLSNSSPEFSLAASPGGEEIVALQIRPSLTDPSALRRSILSLRFDGQETVRVPLGDFFGAGPGHLPHATLPLESTADGTFTTRFVMPFAQSAVVRLDAVPGLESVVRVLHRAAPFAADTYYFHAHWTARGPMQARPFRDIVLADLVGEGAYVGTFLALGNSSLAWWGEGDEKVWVDDDAFPSLFGTGTEDYFGQAYCSPEIYSHPYRAQSAAAGGFGAARGLFSLMRTHVLDPIRFAKRLRFDLELWHWDESAQVTLDTIAYFYLARDGTDNLPRATTEDFRLSPLEP